VLKEVAAILPEHEAKLVYPGDGQLGPVSAGRTRKTGIAAELKHVETTSTTKPTRTRGKPLPMARR
jgi:hypothetical protein